VERVQYPSSLEGIKDLQSRNLLYSGRWGHHFLLVGQITTGWVPKGFSDAPIYTDFEEAL
jgi:hypothetical protein